MDAAAISQWRKARDQISKVENDLEQRDLALEAAKAAAEAAEAREGEVVNALAAAQGRKADLVLHLAAAHSEAKSLEGQVAAAAAEADRLADAASHAAGVLVASLEAEVARREARNEAELAAIKDTIARAKACGTVGGAAAAEGGPAA